MSHPAQAPLVSLPRRPATRTALARKLLVALLWRMAPGSPSARWQA